MDRKLKTWIMLMKFGAKLGCHQKPERSFFIAGYQFPICARCMGIVFGYFGAIILCKYIHFSYLTWTVFILPMAIDGLTQYMGFRESKQYLRLITGLCGGYGLLSLQIGILIKIMR